jgi:hypothetical protein
MAGMMKQVKMVLAGAILIVLSTTLFSVCTAQVIIDTVYVDAGQGSDNNDGTSPETAWQTIDKLNQAVLGPGAVILLRRGQSWTGTLRPAGSGDTADPIVLDAFGEGERPAVHARGAHPEAMYLYNQSHWEIRNVRFTNYDALEPDTHRLRGIYIQGENAGAIEHIHLFNVEVDSVNSEYETFDSRYYGGIFLEVTGSGTRTWFEDVLIDSCYVHDLGRTGISNNSSWAIRSSDSNFGDYVGTDGNGTRRYDNWTPNTDFVIRRSVIERIAGNGIIVRVADKPRIEHNLLDSCGLYISGNAAFCFNTDSALFQYNEACYTIYNEGDTDARGIDSDFRTKYTIIQYNYLHHNGYGGVVATGGSGEDTWLERYNIGTVIRYNLIKDNYHHILRTSGVLSEITMHNNVFYTSNAPEFSNLKIVFNGAWGGAWADGSYFYNNIFYHLAAAPEWDFGDSEDNVFSNNIFYGIRAFNEPDDPEKITGNPLFVDPGSEDPTGYQIQPDSPARLAGKRIADVPDEDYFGNALPQRGLLDIGIHQVSGASEITGFDEDQLPPADVLLYPNPTGRQLHIEVPPGAPIPDRWRILNLAGSECGSGTFRSVADCPLRMDRYSPGSGIFFLELIYPEGTKKRLRFVYLNNS